MSGSAEPPGTGPGREDPRPRVPGLNDMRWWVKSPPEREDTDKKYLSVPPGTKKGGASPTLRKIFVVDGR